MPQNAKYSVMNTLDVLASRLDPIIQARLACELGGLPWTAVLEELDRHKGHNKPPQKRTDLQPQLRMLTERLGGLGFPFDTPNRLVSTLGNELRIVRNGFAHQQSADWIGAFRAADYAVRLLDHFEDREGSAQVSAIRDEALLEVVKESGFAPLSPAVESLSRVVEKSSDDDGDDGPVEPAPEVLARDSSEHTPIMGASRFRYEAWSPVVVGDYELLKELPKKKAKELVRAVATEIVEFEGPIHVDRLIQLIVASFDVSRLGEKRKAQILNQIKATGLEIDPSKFVWPESIDSRTWNEFRPNDSVENRSFLHISPVEIRNAARFIKNRRDTISSDELKAEVLRTFGKKKLTRPRSSHMAHALDML